MKITPQTKRRAVRPAPKKAAQPTPKNPGSLQGLPSDVDSHYDDEANFKDALISGETNWVSRPEKLHALHAKGVNGEGVTVAVIDSGVAPHRDFGDRIKKFRDFSSRKRKPYDPEGHGTHVAGIILGDGDRIDGVAPGADLVAARVSDGSQAIKAIDWVVKNKEKFSIDVLNLSLGIDADDPLAKKLAEASERAIDAGIIVVAAAGNEGDQATGFSTISSPGMSPDVITVGTLDDNGTRRQSDDHIWDFSSQGTEGNGKPDLIAAGSRILGPLAAGSGYAQNLARGAQYLALSGSSQAAPMVTGAVALMLQINPELTQEDVKKMLKRTADKLPNVPKVAQGSGRLDVIGAVNSAKRTLKA